MRRVIVLIAGLVAAAAGAVAYWRRNPRVGSTFMNQVVDPFLLERGLSGVGRSELGTIEHVGRRSGIRRLTPVHPVATADGFRVIVPLGSKSEWAQNVVAAGHCRMQLHDTVYELDEPALLEPDEVEDISTPTRWASDRLGFMFLRLHRFAEAPGALEPIVASAGSAGEPEEVALPPAEGVVGETADIEAGEVPVEAGA